VKKFKFLLDRLSISHSQQRQSLDDRSRPQIRLRHWRLIQSWLVVTYSWMSPVQMWSKPVCC